jgi:hypothetical protein
MVGGNGKEEGKLELGNGKLVGKLEDGREEMLGLGIMEDGV